MILSKWLLGILLCIQFDTAFAQSKDMTAKGPKTWSEVKISFTNYIAKYKNKKLSLSQKQDLIKPVNTLIAESFEVRMLPTEKLDLIDLMVELVRVSQDVDMTNTHSEALVQDYKSNKNAYRTAIERIQSPKDRKRVTEDFRDWESYDLSGT